MILQIWHPVSESSSKKDTLSRIRRPKSIPWQVARLRMAHMWHYPPRVWMQPLSVPLFGMDRNGMVQYHTRGSMILGPTFLMILGTKILIHTYKLMHLVCLIINDHLLQNQCCLLRLFWKLLSSAFFGHITCKLICKLICNYEHQVLDENIFSSLTSITLQGIKTSQKDLIEILLRRPTVVQLPSPCPYLSEMRYILDRVPERFADTGVD